MDTDDIKCSMKNMGIDVKDCVPLRGKNNRTYSYLITLPDIKKINRLHNASVFWGYTRNQNWPQCHKRTSPKKYKQQKRIYLQM